MKNRVIEVQNVPVSISKQELDDYICIIDIAKAKAGESRSADVVKNDWEIGILWSFVLSTAEWINKIKKEK